ncbi:MAG TPA: hypothetical protein VMW23_07405 [Sedimentisphaerales bacterium]|nr:hypothetical protein [Sedimentisphaerales bacterium]
MNKNYRKMAAAAVSAVIVLGVCLNCQAVQGKGGNRWMSRAGGGAAENAPPREMVIERLMDRLSRTDPNRAEELKELRERDPEKFREEIRKVMHQQQGQRRWMRPEGFGFGKGPGPKGFREPAGHLEWLEKNYPEEAEKLAELKGEKPELYRRRLALTSRRYGRIQEAERQHPELAQVLKEDLALMSKRSQLLGKLKAATDNTEKKQLTSELEQVVGNRFDLIVKRKQMRYQQLRKELDKLIEQVSTSEAMLDKYKDPQFKKDHVKQRVEELTSGKEPFSWD